MPNSPLLKNLDIEAVAQRLEAGGDAEAAGLLLRLRDAVERQDEALRDLVADARHISEETDEGGTYTDLHTCADGFDAFATAFGYPPVHGLDPKERARSQASGEEPSPYDGMVHLTGLDHLQARIHMEGGTPDDLAALGFKPVEVGLGPNREVLYLHPAEQDPVTGPTP